jgi:gas vesicle protein
MQKLIIGVAAGIAAGAVIGLLTAPASGAETRKNIVDSAEKLKNRIGRLVGRASDELDELKDVIQHQTEGLSEDVRARILKLIAASKESYKNVAAEANA